jgi:hypothetical protein
MKKSFAFGEAVGLTPFTPFGDATRGREPPVRAGAPRAQPDGANGRRPAAPFGCARDTLRVRKQGRHLPEPHTCTCGAPHTVPVSCREVRCRWVRGTAPRPREAPRPQRGAPDKSSGPCARGAAEGPSPP